MTRKIYSRSWLPNTEGFRFLAVLTDGTIKPDTVQKKANGVHFCDSFEHMAGWIPFCSDKTGSRDALFIGARVYFEDEQYQSNGGIFYLPNAEEQEYNVRVHGEPCISIMPVGALSAKWVPVSQIVFLSKKPVQKL